MGERGPSRRLAMAMIRQNTARVLVAEITIQQKRLRQNYQLSQLLQSNTPTFPDFIEFSKSFINIRVITFG